MLDAVTKLSMLQERFKSGTQKIYIDALNDALTTVYGNLERLDDLTQIKRQVALEKLLNQEIDTLYGKLIEPIQEDMQEFAKIEHESIFEALNGATGVGYAYAGIPKETMKRIISMDEIRLVGDKAYTLRELFDNAKTAQINSYKQIIAGGLASNIGYKAITQKVKEAGARATTNMEAIIHTAISSARDEADGVAYDEFSDVITGWKSVSVLDSRTSLLCASLDGRMYYKKQGYPTYDKIPNRPPRHFRCRSRLVAVTDFKTETTRAQNGDTKGQISAKTKFGEWFSGQSDSFQLNYLGKGRYDLYKTGKLEIKDFVDIKTGELFTIAEIREKFFNNQVKPPKAEKPVKEPTKAKANDARPFIDLGFGKIYNDYLNKGTTRALQVIDKLEKPKNIITGNGWYNHSSKTISTPKGKEGVFFHEYGHFIDNILNKEKHTFFLSHTALKEASDLDAKLLGLIDDGSMHPQFFREKRDKTLTAFRDKWFSKKDVFYTRGSLKGQRRGYKYEAENEYNRGFSDIIDSMTKGKFFNDYYVAGHGIKYYTSLENQMTENFANLFRAYAHKEAWEDAKALFPNLTKAFSEIMDGIRLDRVDDTREIFDYKKLFNLSEADLIDLRQRHSLERIVGDDKIGSALLNWTREDYTEVRKHYLGLGNTANKDTVGGLDELFTKYKGNGSGTVYRGINVYDSDTIRYFKSLKVGDDLTDKAPASWTSDYNIAEEFANIYNLDGQSIIFKLDDVGDYSYKIDQLSELAHEKEVLLAPNTKATVTKVETVIIDDEQVLMITLNGG